MAVHAKHVNAKIKSADDGGTFEVILSTSDVDRDGERIAPYAFAPLPDHITFDIDHALSVAGTVGSGVPTYEQDGHALIVRGRWASTPTANMVRTLVKEGHIRTTSVAFLPTDAAPDKEDGVFTIRKADLLNGAFVAVPANPAAIILAAKSLTVEDRETTASTDSDAPDDGLPPATDAPAPVADDEPAPVAPDDVMPDSAEATATDALRAMTVADIRDLESGNHA